MLDMARKNHHMAGYRMRGVWESINPVFNGSVYVVCVLVEGGVAGLGERFAASVTLGDVIRGRSRSSSR